MIRSSGNLIEKLLTIVQIPCSVGLLQNFRNVSFQKRVFPKSRHVAVERAESGLCTSVAVRRVFLSCFLWTRSLPNPNDDENMAAISEEDPKVEQLESDVS